jgi:hypothetical protein
MTSKHSLETVLELAKRSGSLDDCLRGLAERLNTELSMDRILVGMVHPDGRRLVLVGVWASATTQFRLGATVRLDATAFREWERGRESRVIGREIRVKDMPLVEQVLWLEGMRSWLSLPLREDESTVGVLMFSSESDEAVSTHLLLFETIGLMFEPTLVRLGRARMEEALRSESPETIV